MAVAEPIRMSTGEQIKGLQVIVVDKIFEESGNGRINLVDSSQELRTVKFSDLPKGQYDWKYELGDETYYSRNFDNGEAAHFLIFNPEIVENGKAYAARMTRPTEIRPHMVRIYAEANA